MKLNAFLSQHDVFTIEELDLFLSKEGSGNPNTRKALLAYYRKQGRILPDSTGNVCGCAFGIFTGFKPC